MIDFIIRFHIIPHIDLMIMISFLPKIIILFQLNDVEKIKEILPNSAKAKAHPQLGCAGVPREYGVDTFEPDLQTKNY